MKVTGYERDFDGKLLGITYRGIDGKIQGIANTVHRIIGDESYGQEDLVRKYLGLKKGDTLLQIDSFHPNGVEYTEGDMRKGRGQEFLDKIFQEAEHIQAKGIYTWALTEYMRNFMEKNGFTIKVSGETNGKKHYLCFKSLQDTSYAVNIQSGFVGDTNMPEKVYTIDGSGEGETRVAQKDVARVKSFYRIDHKEKNTDNVYDIEKLFTDAGFKDTDIIYTLDAFYPNGTGKMSGRLGKGSSVLDKIIEDAKEDNVRGIYCFTRSPSAQQFFRKKGFQEKKVKNGIAFIIKL